MRSIVATIGTPIGNSPEAMLEGSVVALSGRIARRLDRLLTEGGVQDIATHDVLWLQPLWGASRIVRSRPLSTPLLQQRWARRRWSSWEQPRYVLEIPEAGLDKMHRGDEVSLQWHDDIFHVHARCGAAVLVRHIFKHSDGLIRDRIRAALGGSLLRRTHGAADFAQAKEWLDALETTLQVVANAIVGRYADLSAEREVARRGSHLVRHDLSSDRQHVVAVARFKEFADAAGAYVKLEERVMKVFDLPVREAETGMLAKFGAFLNDDRQDDRQR